MGNSNFANHPFLLGFERLDRLMERSAQNDGYPPYNIEQSSENNFRISLAVAGFAESDLDITLANGELIIKGTQAEDETPRTYLHQGIAARQFQRRFVLADGVEVRHAYMENGLLHIELRRDVQQSVSQKIEINRR
ncbi:MAG: Hsp20 family protein [Rhodobacteraceae bacterium]|nr:Hsp20 family protein [Paracoccaceae bacterium]